MKVLFLDRDGTILREPPDYRIDSLEKVSFLPFVIRSLARLAEAGYRLVIVSNQDGLGREGFLQASFDAPQAFMIELLLGEGVVFDAVFVDGHFEHENHPDRKPGTGMLLPYLAANEVDLSASFMIGDRKSDAWLAHNLGCRSLTIKDPQSQDGDARIPHVPPAPTTTFTDWRALTAHILLPGEQAGGRR
jgi:imidazoleglycerol-phosphate dehydratase / histidinol-phosphatase